MKKLLASLLFASAVTATGAVSLTGCAHPTTSTFVKVDDVALGRVVVYRNGVAYYERRAHVVGGKLTVNVPRDKVDDFLKSLTVIDAKTNQALPVAFPRQQTGSGGYIEMALELPTKEPVDLVLTYVTESPAWKPSYRIALDKGGKVMMEGWAIVDNTSGEDWKNVTVGVGSSSALSFHYDLWSVRTVARATLATEDRFAVAPPTAVSTYGGQGQDKDEGSDGTFVARLDASELQMPSGHPDSRGEDDDVLRDSPSDEAEYQPAPMVTTASGSSGGGRAKASRAPAAPPVAQQPAADAKLDALAASLGKRGDRVVIAAYADSNRAGAEERARDRANVVREKLIDKGIAPGLIEISASASPGAREDISLSTRRATEQEVAAREAAGDPRNITGDTPVGESHFQSETPMTVNQGTSVMVPMVKGITDGAEVYFYDPESERGNERFAFKAIRIKNPTDSTLETGPVTVYGDGRFIGEGLTEPIPPHASVVVPFALDRQVVVETSDNTENQISRLMTLQRGILTAEVQHLRHKKITLTSRLREPTTVYIRHTIGKGWNLIDSPTSFERLGSAHLFEVKLAPMETKTVEISEATPLTRTLDLTTTTALDMMKLYVETPLDNAELQGQLRELLATHRALIDARDKLESLSERLGDYRTRMDELHVQLVTLKAVKTGGDLMVHLRKKMADISERVQRATIEQVDTQEKIMLSRIRFQDQLAELRLEEVKPAGSGSGLSTPTVARKVH